MVHFTMQFSTGSVMNAITSRAKAAAQAMRQAVLDSSTPYVPYRTGALAASGSITEEGVAWTADHAQKCYYAKRPFSREKHPLAQAGWFEAAKAVDLELWRQTAAKALTGKEF
ncbi:MAG: hypothetical protein IJ325_06900 [Clostridia bacterium]|nr:hypothetical protein [Clostridia bacterium]